MTLVKESVIEIAQNCLRVVNQFGIHTNRAVLFGSWAREEAEPDSDIDLVVLAPEFDRQRDRDLVRRLWGLRVEIPEAWRIEPIACGEREWLEDDSRMIIEIARQEGEMIDLEPETA